MVISSAEAVVRYSTAIVDVQRLPMSCLAQSRESRFGARGGLGLREAKSAQSGPVGSHPV